MDDRRFDQLTRRFGAGASRRELLKGLLGLGGAVAGGTVAGSEADARTLSSRPRITTAPPPSCPLPNQLCGGACCEPGKCQDGHCCPNTTDVWCGADGCCDATLCAGGNTCCEQDDQVCGTACCPSTASCARSGNTDVCCDPAEGGVPCGLDCCADPNQCCDGECCPDGSICLTRVFAEGPFVEEEVCCRVEAICTGAGAFAGQAVCCDDEQSDCCLREDGEPVCIDAETQCCRDQECPDNPQFCDSGVCLRGSQTCDLSFVCGDGGTCCPGQSEGESGVCVEDDQCCDSVECGELTDFPACIIGVCNLETHRCEAVSACDLGQECCALNDSNVCAPVDDTTVCDLEEGGSGICCSGECADSSLCFCTRDIECDPARCEGCFGERCRVRCGHTEGTFDLPACDGAGTCVECLEDDDCFGSDRYCNLETNTCFACRTNDDCFECRVCDEATGTCVADLSVQGAPCEIPGETGFSCCFGDCMPTCASCASDADCTECETCDLSAGPDLAHCLPCFFNLGGCCFDDFCLPDGVDCCEEDSDCPPPECSNDTLGVIRYECVPVTANGGYCQAVTAQTCEGCASCEETGTGPECVAGCQPGMACCVTDQCQPLRTCPFGCAEDADCPGECHTCVNGMCEIDQDKCFGDCGFCASTGGCVANAQLCPGDCHVCSFDPTTNTGNCIDWDPLCVTGEVCCDGECEVGQCTATTTASPALCQDDTDCTEPLICCDGTCEDPGVCFCKDCEADGTCQALSGCCLTTDDCEPRNCFAVSCNTTFNVCAGISDCREGLGCCTGGTRCNQDTGVCEASICEPACEPPLVCCDGDCEDPGVCFCKGCETDGTCQALPGCCLSTDDCEAIDCVAVSCNEVFNICVGITDCREGEDCCSDGLVCNRSTGSCLSATCQPACESPLICCDGVCEDPGVCLCQGCEAEGTCQQLDGCCLTTNDCAPGNCVAVSCNEVFNICVGISDCRKGDDCCTGGLVCNETTGSCEMSANAAAEQAQPACTPIDLCAAGQCGSVDDGCGGLLDCGACPQEVTTPPEPPPADSCSVEGRRCVADDQCCDGLLCRSRTCGTTGIRRCRSDCNA